MERDNSTRFQSAYIISLTVTNLWGNFLTVDRSRFCRYQVFFQILRNPAVRKHSFKIRRSNVWFFYITLRTWNIISIIYIYIILSMCDWKFKLNETFKENINHGPLHCDHRHFQRKIHYRFHHREFVHCDRNRHFRFSRQFDGRGSLPNTATKQQAHFQPSVAHLKQTEKSRRSTWLHETNTLLSRRDNR